MTDEQQQLEQENRELRERVKALEAERADAAGKAKCAYCGETVVIGIDAAEHMTSCAEHPMAKMTRLAKEQETELEGLREELEDNERTFEMQHRRTVKADKLWLEAHGNSQVLPDLGMLIDWLLERAEQAERENIRLNTLNRKLLLVLDEHVRRMGAGPAKEQETELEVLRARAEQAEAKQQEQERITLNYVERLHKAEWQLAEARATLGRPDWQRHLAVAVVTCYRNWKRVGGGKGSCQWSDLLNALSALDAWREGEEQVGHV